MNYIIYMSFIKKEKLFHKENFIHPKYLKKKMGELNFSLSIKLLLKLLNNYNVINITKKINNNNCYVHLL